MSGTGPGLDEWWRGKTFRLAVPECHEHCSSCMDTGCPHPEHNLDWQEGYVTAEEDYNLWLCPSCFEKARERFELQLVPH